MIPSFAPRFTINNATAAGLTAIERARGFLEAATLSAEWVRRMSQRALLLEAHHTTHIEGTLLTLAVNREYLTNTSLRGRFGIEPQNIATASRLIKEAVEAGAIAPVDPDSAKSHRRYVPWWAAASRTDDKGER